MGALVGGILPTLPMQAQTVRPNIVHVFADDFGWGSVGFNGQTRINTPNLDALAAAGMRLANSYSTPVCAPSRSVLYTGFHQGHALIDGNNALSANTSFRAEDVMTGEVMGAVGYSTGVFGKWGFGATQGSVSTAPVIDAPNSLPSNHGFDEFYGYLNHGAAHDYFSKWMWQTDVNAPQGLSTSVNNDGPGGTAEYTHDLIAARSEQFIAAHAGDESPFYMQVNYTIPHFDLDSIAAAPGGYGEYASEPWTAKQKAYAAMITRMDASVGALIEQLRDPNADGNESDSVLSNTLVMFTSDNGPTVEDDSPIDFFDANGVFRGGKFEVYEGGIHMPALAYWPGTIEPGSVNDYRTDLADLMATAADLAGAETPVGIDGTSIVPTLTGEGRQRERDYLVFEHQGSRGADPEPRIGRWAVVRQDGMKLIQYNDESQVLFDLIADPDESSPLSLGNPTYAQIAAELQAAAIAEGVLRGVVQFRSYVGANGGNVENDSSWDGAGRPNGYWSATIANAGATPRIAHVTDDVTTLGVEISGQSALQVVDVHAGSTLSGRNEVRIGANGRVDLSGGVLATNRWVDMHAGGELCGEGTVVGDVYNEGVMSPGRQDDAPAWAVAAPPTLPPISLDTGVVTAAAFNFTGVQDDVPLGATSTLSPYLEVSKGLDFGPGVSPKLGNGGTDAGNEFNVMGHTGPTLTDAKNNGDYISFSVDPVDGAGAIPSSVSFRVWRNGGAAAKNFAILSSLDGFATALAQATYNDTGSSAQHMLTASLPAIEAVTEPIEYRLYSWGATDGAGNTHVNLASLSARFVAVPTLEFNFAGVQDSSPLMALKRQGANVALASGLHFGPGVAMRDSNNVGNEFHAAGFSTGPSLQTAIDGADYLSFSVQSIEGMAMLPDSVSFTLWRQGVGSATDYAIMSSTVGFASGLQMTQAHHTTVGSGNQLVLTGTFFGAPATTEPVEFRLYGWNAATSLDSTHVIAASMRARFASVAGSTIDPTGAIAVQGDFFHQERGTIAIDLGGLDAGIDHDAINVFGSIELEGDLSVSLADVGGAPFQPSLGDRFEVLTATEDITGQFANASLPELAAGLDWQIDYEATAVVLGVFASADFNRDGSVDGVDLAMWQGGAGQAADAEKADGDADGDGAVDGADFLAWQRQLNVATPSITSSYAVSEPSSAVVIIIVSFIFACQWSFRRLSPLGRAAIARFV